jgi:nucleotide-binding universal stress UspA family protein
VFSGLFSAEQQNQILSHIDEKLADLAGKAALASGVPVHYRIEKGRIHTKILEVAKDINAQFIMMGTSSSEQGEAPVKRVGANTSRIIRSSACPVITVRSKQLYNGCRNILLPLDLTKETRQKVTMGIEIAKNYGAGIRVVSALWSKNNSDIINKLQQQGNQVVNFISSAGIDCTFEIIESDGGEKTLVPSLLKYAAKCADIDLVIILTQQESGIVEYFVGSHAQEFIRLSDIPVMSIVPKELGIVNSYF